ncbi:unnamed protein product [Blepharisma stoltei]|uniref:Uncharacterized protein n=1 Tax=Blepharisma stoltei TaxID=1481888 RepID=A0AAU9J8Z9_9CILI|nr:unnamed protein product [Blepharisma stoltei]
MNPNLASVSEREERLKERLREEESKKNINDSKFRAVAQHMDYEGFRQMVLGANLKPIKAGEIFSMTGQNRTRFNNLGTTDNKEERKEGKISFINRWKRCRQDAEKWQLIQEINKEELLEEMNKFVDFEVFSEILRVLYEGVVRRNLEISNENAEEILRVIIQIKGFENAKKIMTKSEKAKISEMLDFLNLNEIKSLFGLQ